MRVRKLSVYGLVLLQAMWGWPAMPAEAQTPAASIPVPAGAPAAVTHHFHRAANGQLYVPAGIPLHLGFGLEGVPLDDGDRETDASKEKSVTLKEGPNQLQFGDVKLPVIADGTPPQTVLEVVDPLDVEVDGMRILPTHPKLKLTASDRLSGVERTLVSLDGGPFQLLTREGPVFTAEGVHHLRYYSIDEVGNAEKVQEYTFRLDDSAPKSQLTVSGPHKGTVLGVGTQLTLAAKDEWSGVSEVFYKVDNGPEETYSHPLQVDMMGEGKHVLSFHAQDRVGNQETAQSYGFFVDREPPVVQLSLNGPEHTDGGVRYVTPATQIKITGADNVDGEVPVHYRVDETPQTVVYEKPFALPEASGGHTVHMDATDSVANRTEQTVDDLYVDKTAPTTEADFSRPYFTLDGEIVLGPQSLIALTATDYESGVGKVTYTVDGGAEQVYTTPFPIAALGSHVIRYKSVDHVGNVEPERELKVRVQPATQVVNGPNTLDEKRWYQDPKLGLMGPENLPFEVRIAESPKDGAPTLLVSDGPEQGKDGLTFTTAGVNTLKVILSPKAAGFKVLIDNAAPHTQVAMTGAKKAEAGGVTYYGPGLKVALSAADDAKGVVSGVWKTLDQVNGGPFNAYSTPLEMFVREGAYQLKYYSVDNVGNAETPHEADFTVDTRAPRTRREVAGPHRGDTVAPATKIALTATDNLSGVGQLTYKIDNGPERTYSGPIAMTGLADGPHKMTYGAVDLVGNREDAHVWAFGVQGHVGDASYTVRGPNVVHGASVYVAPGSSIVLRSADGKGVMYAMDGGEMTAYAGAIAVPEEGSHRISFHSQDELGNVSPTHTIEVMTDKSSPTSRVHFEGPQVTGEGLTMIGGTTRVVIDASAGAVGGALVEYSMDGGRHWTPYHGAFTVHSSGTMDLMYRARNPLQTVEAPQHARFMVDAAGPVIALSYSAPAGNAGGNVVLEPGTLLFVDATDKPAGLKKITYKLDDQPELIYRNPLSSFHAGKVHTLVIVAEDLLGNRTERVLHLEVKEGAR